MKLIVLSVFFVIFLLITSFIEESKFDEKIHDPQNKIELGKLLFNDSILSKGNQISCASCHKSQFAFADNVQFSFGFDSIEGTRNAPSIINLDYRYSFFWDGRAETLEEQVLMPIENPSEMNLMIDEAIRKLNEHKDYNLFFKRIFHEPANKRNLCDAIASYEKTLVSYNSPFDLYENKHDTTLLSISAKRGAAIFFSKGKCNKCHYGSDFTPDNFKNIGLFNGETLNDSGRYKVTKKIEDLGSFKISALRNVSMTPPYMHNGMFKTLKEVIDYYNSPNNYIPNSINRDSLLNTPLNLSELEKNDLEAFLISLTDIRFN